MTAPFPDPEQFPAEFSAGERAILTAVKGWQEEAREVSDAKHAENAARMEAMDREIKTVAATMRAAYPDGDADGHRRYHEALIRKAEMRARFWETLLTELVSKGLWALVIFLAAATFYMVKEKLTK